MKKVHKIRIPATSVELCMLLGTILRKNLGRKIKITEHWGFISKGMHMGRDGELRAQAYLGAGRFFGGLKKGEGLSADQLEGGVEVRVLCQTLPRATGSEWVVALWLKFPNKVVRSWFFKQEPGGPIVPDNSFSRGSNLLPPPEIAFDFSK